MQKYILSSFILALMVSVTSYESAFSEELPYAMAQCHLSVLRLDRLDKTLDLNGLKFKEVRYNGNDVLMMKPRWTGVNVNLTPFMKVFTYRYANTEGLDFDVTIE